MSETDHRDELIAVQRQLLQLQNATIATLRAYLQAAHETAKRHEATIAAMRSQVPRKDVQA